MTSLATVPTGTESQAQKEAFAVAFIIESSGNNLTAHAGGGKASALVLTNAVNRLTTVASPGDSVLLPLAQAGWEVVLINSGANSAQVFGAGTDTINDVATATGIAVPPNSITTFSCPVDGKWYGLPAAGFAGAFATISAQDAIVAHAGGGQANATPLAAMINRVSTVATALDSVVLPAATPGLQISVYADGAQTLAVFPAGTDAINDLGASVAMPQMKDSIFVYSCSSAGKWETEAAGTGFAGAFPTVTATDNITAFAGGGQANATALTTVINRVTTVATIGDSCLLPPSKPGMQVTVTNAAANSMNLFPVTGEQVNALGANAAFAIAGGKTAILSCASAGQWHAVLSA